MQLFLIDPEEETIQPWDYNGDWRTLAPALGCQWFDVVEFNQHTKDAVYVDDEGLLNDPQHFFKIRGAHSPLAGKGLVAGCDEDGETVSPQCDLAWLRANVKFLHRLIH
jgi:hypothetical protein